MPVPDAAAPDPLAAVLPGGRERFVVSLAHLDAAARSNWVRLGTYTFRPDAGEVDASLYLWSQADPVQRQGIGTTPAGACVGGPGEVHACEVLSAGGFTGAPNEVRTGTYSLSNEADGVHVTLHWGIRGLRHESWRVVPAPDGLFVQLAFVESDGATDGYAAGSHAELSARRAVATILAAPGPLDYHFVGWAHDAVSRHHQAFDNHAYTLCDDSSWVATYMQPASPDNCHSGCSAPYDADTTIQYTLSRVGQHDRRDTWWHWCTCLAEGRACYDRNSHVKPLMQALDDTGTFRGWVGVEASFAVPATPDVRGADMLAAFVALTP